ncbi:MAG: DUF2087 domain-containing protein [Usitatibacteraceae bacterium]
MNTSREIVPLVAADISAFCKNLRQQLATAGHEAPSHLAFLNMLAKSAGYRNYQTLKAQPPTPMAVIDAVETRAPKPAAAPITLERGSTVPLPLRKLLTCFDTQGRMTRWPNKYAAQQTAIWALWSRLPAHRELTEKQVNDYLSAAHTYGDPATLRRELVNAKLLWRTVDCSVYRKEQRRPNEETRTFLDLLFSHSASVRN